MKHTLSLLAFFFLIGCHNNNGKRTEFSGSANCSRIRYYEKPINHLLENPYAKSLSDSFILSLYIKNYKVKFKKEGDINDSISLLSLNILPTIIAYPLGDSSTYELGYTFTNNDCSYYYDSILKSNKPLIHGVRFSIAEKKISCYISTDGKLLIDKTFLNIDKEIMSSDFLKEVSNNKASLSINIKNLLKKHTLHTN